MFDVLYSHGVFLTPAAALRAGAAGLDLSETCLEPCAWGLILSHKYRIPLLLDVRLATCSLHPPPLSGL